MTAETRYDRGNRYTHFDSAGITTIRSTATRLMRININTSSTDGIISIYNGTTAGGDLVSTISASVAAHTKGVEFNVALSGGLTVVRSGTSDFTVIYR